MTNDMKHTLGPWDVGKTGNLSSGDWQYCVRDGRKLIATVNHLNPFDGNAEPLETANLIAAAHDLLEALKVLMARETHIADGVSYPIDLARAAIAKAEGRS